MNEKQPESLPLKKQAELEKLKIHLSSLHSLLLQRSGFLVLTASLSIAMLVIFSLDRKLIPISDAEFKILATSLLLIIPVLLLTYVIEIHDAINRTHKAIERIYGENLLKKGPLKEIIHSIITNLSLFAVVLISLVIFYILYVMWFGV